MYASHPTPPNVVGNLLAHSMAKLGSLILVQTLASSCSPGYHCQPVPKLHTLLASLMSTNVSGPTHLMVGPVSMVRGTSGKDATLVVNSRLGSLGQVSCFSGPPLGSLNYLYAKRGKLHNVDSLLRSVRNPRTRNIYVPAFGNNS